MQGRTDLARQHVDEAVARLPLVAADRLVEVGEGLVGVAAAAWLPDAVDLVVDLHRQLAPVVQRAADSDRQVLADAVGCMASIAAGRLDDEMGRLDEDQRERLARGITAIQAQETDAPESLIHVVFTGHLPGMAWSSCRPGAPNIINASVRSGRSEQTRVRMMDQVTALMCEVMDVEARDVIVALFSFPSHWGMEAGMVLPPTEKQAEAAWNAGFYARYPGEE